MLKFSKGMLGRIATDLVENEWPELRGGYDIGEPIPAAVPRSPGIYVIVTGDGTQMPYPRGTSQVLYIGKADQVGGLRKRLGEHHRAVRKIRSAPLPDHFTYEPLYEWIHALGGRYLFSVAPTPPARRLPTPQVMESYLLDQFDCWMRRIPHGNQRRGGAF